MHSSSHRHGGRSDGKSARETRGRLLDRGWRYDLEVWFVDTFLLRGRVRELRRRVIDLSGLRSWQAALDVGCGTGTLPTAARSIPAGEDPVAG